MRENRSYGSVRGAARKGGPYRDHIPIRSVKGFPRCFVGIGLYVVSTRITDAHTGFLCSIIEHRRWGKRGLIGQ